MSPRVDFGLTWWGRAWVEALEQRARLDPNRLPRGRTYARQDRVQSLSAGPGVVTALVAGSRATPYRVHLRVRELTEFEWQLVLDAISARAGHAAALLDGELLPEVLDDVAEAGVDLLPGPGELGPQCSCPDWADPCKHAAAVCYLVARLLDGDPFELLHLRGRTRDQVLAEVRARRRTLDVGDGGRSRRGGLAPSAGRAGRGAGPVATVAARDAFTRAGPTLDDLRALDQPSALDQPGPPAPLPVAPPVASGVSVEDLNRLVADAAERARALVTGTGDSGLGLNAHEDLARRAAHALGTRSFDAIAYRAGVSGRSLVRLALAWQAGGPEGVAVLDGPAGGFGADRNDGSATEDGPVPLTPIDEARAALATTTTGGRQPRVQGNRVTAGSVQLRQAPSGRWYRFVKAQGQWQPDGPPSPDPRDLVRADER